MLVIPAIDLKNGQCVRLTQGAKESSKVYSGEPVEMAESFVAAGAIRLHVVNLDGAFGDSDSANLTAARAIFQAVKAPVQFGGGITCIADIERLLEAGASYVIVGTLAQEQGDLVAPMVERFGSRVIVGIDARDGIVRTRGWRESGGVRAVELAKRMAGIGVTRIIYTDIARDGMLDGVNINATREIAEASGLTVTASGGIGSLEHVAQVKELASSGVDSVIVGKALYEGLFTLAEALALAND